MAILLTIIFVIWCIKHPNPMSNEEYKKSLKDSDDDFPIWEDIEDLV